MTHRAALLALAAATLFVADEGRAGPLESQRAPVAAQPPIHCVPPCVARQVKVASGKLVWRCIKLKVA